MAESFIFSLNSTVPIFLTMIIGYVLKQIGFLSDEFIKGANKYVFKVALPVMLFIDISSADLISDFNIKFVLYCMIVTCILFAVSWLIAELFCKDKKQIGALVQGCFRGSAAVLGLAFIQNMYSTTGMAPLMIASAVPLYNIFSVIVLTFKASKEYGGDDISGLKFKEQMKKALINIAKNPIIIGIFLGIPFSLLRVDFPVIVDRTLDYFGRTSTPIALLCIGAGFEGRKAIKKIAPTLWATFYKLFLQAGLFLPLAVAMGFRNQNLVAILIMLASPSTASGYIMAKNMGNDSVLSSSIIVLTTLLSSVSLTLLIFILRAMALI